MDELKPLGLRMAALRVEKEMTPIELAKESGVPLKIVIEIENGDLGVSIIDLCKVGQALDCTLDVRFKPIKEID